MNASVFLTPMDATYPRSRKFYWGIVFVVVSLLIGKITTVTFIAYFPDSSLRWLSLVVYLLSWPILIIGIWWVGSEYYGHLKKYFTYRHYHESLREGTKKAYQRTKEKTQQLQEQVRQRLHRKNL